MHRLDLFQKDDSEDIMETAERLRQENAVLEVYSIGGRG